jgi:hypothetical protein
VVGRTDHSHDVWSGLFDRLSLGDVVTLSSKAALAL